MYNEMRKLSDPRPTWNSEPMRGNAVATSNQFRVSATTPRLMTASMPQRAGPCSARAPEAMFLSLDGSRPVVGQVGTGWIDVGRTPARVPFGQLIDSISLCFPLPTVAWVNRETTGIDGLCSGAARLLSGHELRTKGPPSIGPGTSSYGRHAVRLTREHPDRLRREGTRATRPGRATGDRGDRSTAVCLSRRRGRG